MTTIQTGAILTRIREVLEDAAGDLRTIPVERFSGELATGLDPDYERALALSTPRVEASIIAKRPSPASPPSPGSIRLYELDISIRVVRLVEHIDQLDDDERDALYGLAAEDGDLIAQALSYPGNLSRTSDGRPTDLASGMLQYLGDSTTTLGNAADGAQTISTVHQFRGVAIARPSI